MMHASSDMEQSTPPAPLTYPHFRPRSSNDFFTQPRTLSVTNDAEGYSMTPPAAQSSPSPPPGEARQERRERQESQGGQESQESQERVRRPSFTFLSRARSKSRSRTPVDRDMPFRVPSVTTPSGSTMLWKQKLRDQEEQLRQPRDARAKEALPTLPAHPRLPLVDTSSQVDLSRPNTYPSAPNSARTSTAASNFSRPHGNNYTTMPASSSTNTDTSSSSPAHLFSVPGSRYGSASPASAFGLSPGIKSGEYESITHRGRSSYGGSDGNVNSPRRVRRRKEPAAFNVLIIGGKQCGKTSFVDFLKTALDTPVQPHPRSPSPPRVTTTDGSFTSHYVETEFGGERVGLTLWDSRGLETNLVDLQVREMTAFIEKRFEETFTEEQKLARSPGVKDTHIHAAFLLLDPGRLDDNVGSARVQAACNALPTSQAPCGLDNELDLLVMRALAGKTTVIPIITKADTLTTAHMEYLKRSVWSSIQGAKLDPLEALGLEEDTDDDLDPDSEDVSSPDSGTLPAQLTTKASNDEPHPHHPRTFQVDDDSELIDNLVNRSDSAPSEHSTSSQTTPSPAQAQPSKSAQPASGMPNSQARTVSRSSLHAAATTAAAAVSDTPYIPFSVMSSDPHSPYVTGRQFAWGMADPFNAAHCDFVRLRDSVFAEWRGELRDAARDKWYEGWRTSRLKRSSPAQRVRQAGGVTPVAAVPREGRSISGGAGGARKTSGGLAVVNSDAPRTAGSFAKAEALLGSPSGYGGAAY